MSSASARPAPPSTRASLLAAGRELLLSRRPFSMGAVARLAGVSRQAVYLHFADRYALLEGIVEEALAESASADDRRRIDEAATGRAALEAFVDTVVAVTAAHGVLEQAVRGVIAADPELTARWAARRGRTAKLREVLARLADEGVLRPDLAPKHAEAALLAFTSADFLVPLTRTMRVDAVAMLVHRSVRAALLR